jgi:hypothetical protein
MTEITQGFRQLLQALEAVSTPYMVCGSMASFVHGVVRYTQDVDLVVDLKPDKVEPLAAALGTDFYADAGFMKEAVRRQASFNVIHLASAYKFDLFVLTAKAFEQQEFQRRILAKVGGLGPEPVEFFVATAEDTILSKLVWYRMGGEVSEKQWTDLRGMRDIQKGQLDEAYLRQWAARLGVADLLADLLSGG